MTREQILSDYNVSDHGIIQNPGKFESEMLYAPYFYDSMLNGGGDETLSDNSELFELSDDDHALFPELGSDAFLVLTISDSGFVSTDTFDADNDPRDLPYESAFADDDEDSDEPDDDAITTTDHLTFYQYGKVWLEVESDDKDYPSPPDDLNTQIKAQMDRQQFWPDVWFISDHGNAHRIDLSEETAK